MMSKTLTDHIIDTIKAEANNNPAPQRCRITRVYSDGNHVDVLTDEGKIEYVDAIGSNFIEGNNAVILFFDEEFRDYVVIADSDITGKCDKTNGANQLTDSSAYSNLGTSSNATQKQINNAINTKIGAILTILGNCEDLLGE